VTQSLASRETHFVEARNFDRLRHYGDRPPVWIKSPIALLEDDAYLGLTGHERGVLHGLWLLCAKLEYDGLWPRLPFNTRYLSRQLGLRVKAADLEALADSHVIEILDSETGPESVRACTQRPCKSNQAADCASVGAGIRSEDR
jgi:hypothetical protein